MAHEISKIDMQEGIKMAWHKLTKVRQDLTLENNVLTSWEVIPKKLCVEGESSNCTEFKILTASDLPNVHIGVPYADSYVPILNKEFLDCIKEATFGISGLQLSSVGSVMERNRVFVSFDITEANFIHGKRHFECSLNFGNSHDKGQPFWANTSNITTVCANTFGMNLKHKSKNVNVRVRHTKNAHVKLENISEIIDGALGAQAEFKNIFLNLTEIKTNESEAEKVFAGFIGKGQELSTRAENNVNRLVTLFRNGAGNNGENRSDLFQAVTDFYSHEHSGGDNRMKQWVSSEFGSGSVKKREFLTDLTENFDELVLMGNKTLSLT